MTSVQILIPSKVEIHPRLPHHRLVEFAKSQGIVVEGYSPFGNANALYDQQNQLLQDATIGLIAKKHSVSAPTVITNWMIGRRIVTLPRSSNPEHIQANAQQINLDDEDNGNLNAQALTFSRRYCDLSELVRSYILLIQYQLTRCSAVWSSSQTRSHLNKSSIRAKRASERVRRVTIHDLIQ